MMSRRLHTLRRKFDMAACISSNAAAECPHMRRWRSENSYAYGGVDQLNIHDTRDSHLRGDEN